MPELIILLTVSSLLTSAPLFEEEPKPAPPATTNYSAMLEFSPDKANLRMPTPEEIQKLGSLWPDVPPEQNAACYFAKAVKAMAPNADIPAGSSSSGEKPYAGDVAAFEKWVGLNQTAFKLMREGFKQEVCRPIFLISLENGQPVADLAFLAGVRHSHRGFAPYGASRRSCPSRLFAVTP